MIMMLSTGVTMRRELSTAEVSLRHMKHFLLTMLVGCAAGPSSPNRPQFVGVETESWLVYQVDEVGRDDLLPAFEASARSHGCSTEQLGSESGVNIAGTRRSYYGVNASCEEGAIALITLVGGGVRIGCAKPTTRQDCDSLLRRISRAR
jgi:hypothetical protein